MLEARTTAGWVYLAAAVACAASAAAMWAVDAEGAALLALGAATLFALCARRSERPVPGAGLVPESSWIVSFDDVAITLRAPTGESGAAAWADLEAVLVRTNDHGPFACDFYTCLITRGGNEIAIPQGATGDPELVRRLHRLPGFDADAFLAACGSTSNAEFDCWKRADTGGGVLP